MVSLFRQRVEPILVVVFAALFLTYQVASIFLGANSFAKAIESPASNSQPAQVESNDDASEQHLVYDDKVGDYDTPIGLNYVASYWPTRVQIANAQIDLPLTGSMEQQGIWEVSEDGANFAINTAIPNDQSGNTVIFGHDRPHLFRNIHNLKPGDEIKVYGADKVYVYTMDGSKIVSPSDISVMQQTKTATLTLITCDGWLSKDRYVVTAKLVQTSQF